MAGGLMQLVAYGAQDVYLTGNPKVTFFQAVYKRHTNFAMEAIQQTVNGTAANNQRISVTIARNGDLVGYMYVELVPVAANLSSNNTYFDTNWVAERAFSAVELTIGGQRIDKHFQTWWRLYAELFLSDENKVQYNKMTTMSNPGASAALSPASPGTVYLPLLFFFNRNPGLYLPLIALQYHEVRLDIDCAANYSNYFGASTLPVIWANYVFLDTEERRRFAQKGHEYLIEQVQHTGGDSFGGTAPTESTPATIRLSFNHPVKELCWAYQNSAFSATAQLNSLWNFTTGTANVNVTCDMNVIGFSNTTIVTTQCGAPQIVLGNGYRTLPVFAAGAGVGSINGWTEEGSYQASAGNGTLTTGSEVGPLHKFKLILNGQDRFKEQYGKYFNQIQPFYHHTGNPYPGIYNYSFALHPEEHQPTGTCNFSRIDNAQVQVWLKTTLTTFIQKMFAVNYNILRIQSGMGGLAFSN
jgi:Large eukaryotic DNA virus major capsid protein/Major capsid protein N-terminus